MPGVGSAGTGGTSSSTRVPTGPKGRPRIWFSDLQSLNYGTNLANPDEEFGFLDVGRALVIARKEADGCPILGRQLQHA